MILYDVAEQIATIILNRPAAMDAFLEKRAPRFDLTAAENHR